MSERNGDRARFNRERRSKILRRKRTRELRKAQAAPGRAPDSRELATRL